MLPHQNGLISAIEPLSMAALPGNQCAMGVGALVQAKSAMYYLVDYITKDSHLLSNVASAVSFAYQKVARYPSVAANTGMFTSHVFISAHTQR